MDTIETVVFDVGRVLVGIRIGDRFSALMRKIGIPPDEAFGKYWGAPEVRQLMVGRIDAREFHAIADDRYGLRCPFEEFAEAWSDIFTPMPGMEELFNQVADRHRVGLLSDTDPIHWSRIMSLFPWLGRVAKPTLSYEVGYLKPQGEIYAAAANNVGCVAGRCLFIDDTAGNVEGARAAGMRGVHFRGPDPLRRDLAELGLL